MYICTICFTHTYVMYDWLRIEIEEEAGAGGVRGGGPADVRGGRGTFLATKD